MKFKITIASKPRHVDGVTAVGWMSPPTSNNNSTSSSTTTPSSRLLSSSAAAAAAATSSSSPVLISASDDGTVCSWSAEGEWSGRLTETPDFGITTLHPCPSSSSSSSAGIVVLQGSLVGSSSSSSASFNDVFACACSDGSLRLITRGGKEEKRVIEACSGGAAVTCVQWNHDGTALVTGGEDGSVKVWSRSAVLRSVISTSRKAVYAVSWGPDGSSIVYASGKDLTIVSLQPNDIGSGGNSSNNNTGTLTTKTQLPKTFSWKAHDNTVLACHWSSVTSRIVSGGEDCRYRVWDSFGRQLFMSSPLDHVITSVAWAPSGEHFAVGSFETLRLCDSSGWSHARESLSSSSGSSSSGSSSSGSSSGGVGSVLSLAWTADGSALAGGCGSGAVVFATVLEKKSSSGSAEAILLDSNRIRVTDVSVDGAGDREELDFRDRVVEFAIGHGHLVAATPTQIHVFSSSAWHAPHIFDSRAAPSLILLAPRVFLTADAATGLNIFTYDGRVVSTPKLPGLRADLLPRAHVALSNDVLAIVDRVDPRVVRLFDARNGRTIGTGYTHTCPIVQISISQSQVGGLPERRLALIDSSHDLFVTPVVRPMPIKLAVMVDSVSWASAHPSSDSSSSGIIMSSGAASSAAIGASHGSGANAPDILAALVDGKLAIWLCPAAFWVDRDLAAASRIGGDGNAVGGNGVLALANNSGALGANSIHGGQVSSGGGGSGASSSSSASSSASSSSVMTLISFGALPKIVSFVGGRITVQRGDGAMVHASAPGYAYASLMYECIAVGRWEDAVRLARFVKDVHIWAALSACAISARHLDTAEVALAACGSVDKLQFILHIKEQPLAEIRNAELALYRRAPDEAEQILLQCTPPLAYRAIKMNIRLARWTRALELAQQVAGKAYVDVVLAYRQRYLVDLHRKETIDAFAKLTAAAPAGSLEWAIIKPKKTEAKAKELAAAMSVAAATNTATGGSGMGSSSGGAGGGGSGMSMMMGSAKGTAAAAAGGIRGSEGKSSEEMGGDGYLG